MKRKRCPRCCAPGEDLPVEAFNQNRSQGSGYGSYCRICEAEAKKEYGDRRREKTVERRTDKNNDLQLVRGPEFKLSGQQRMRWSSGLSICDRCRGPWNTPEGEMEAYCRARTDAGFWVACERPDERDMQRMRAAHS